MSVLKFLSTPSGWRATITFWSALAVAADFYPRPPGGGRLGFHRDVRKAIEFLSTPSGWRATYAAYLYRRRREISIHALRVEGDSIRSR